LSHSVEVAKSSKYKETQLWTWARTTWLGEVVRSCKTFKRQFLGWAFSEHESFPDVAEMKKSMAILGASVSGAVYEERDAQEPIFLFSAGWRTGSTLLQRILVTDPRLLLWGEPLGDMALFSRISEMVSNFISPRDLELWKKQGVLDPTSLARSWIANLYPPGNDFRLALRALCDRWLAQPARDLGFSRWGFKEVRLGAPEALLLYWLYPKAKFVFLVRHPYDCYRSLADSRWQHVYQRYPDKSINCAILFARLWNHLAVSWSELPEGFPSVQIRYEDLIGSKFDFRKLESWLGIDIKESAALSVSIGGTAERPRLSWIERWIISREAGVGMRAFGYPKEREERKSGD